MSNLPSRKRRKLLFWAIGLVAFYAILGFLILPPIIRRVVVKNLSQQLDREVSIEKIKLNPFALSVAVDKLLIKDKDGEPFVSWDEVYVNLQAASFFGHSWIIKEISITNSYVRAQVNKDYSLNFSDLITKFSTNAAPKETSTPQKHSAPLSLRIEELRIAGATASVVDLTQRTPFKRTVGPLTMTLTNFWTDPANSNPYSFTGTTDAGEKISWSGFFFLSPLRSQGDFALENFSLTKYAPLYQDFLQVEVKDGVVDLHTSYRFELSESNRVAIITNTGFALHSFKLNEPNGGGLLAELPEFAVSGVSADATARHAEINSITASGGILNLRRSKDAAINVVELSKPPAAATNNASGAILLLLQSVTNAVTLLLQSTNAWSGIVHDVAVTNCGLNYEDLVNSRPVRLNLQTVSLSVKNISNLPGTNLSASVFLLLNTNGTIKVDATASFLPPAVDVDLALDHLELRPLDPYLEAQVNLFVLDSKLGLTGHVSLRTPPNALPVVTFKGDTWLDDFSTVDGVLAEDLLKWKSVRVSGIDANLNPPAVAINEIAINDAYARLIIETNHTINLLAALRLTDTNAPAPEEKAPAKKTRDKKKPAVTEQISQSTNTSPALPKISVASIVISNTEAQFTDRSIEPNVNVSVKEIGGTIAGISTEAMQHADVNLRARVDGVGPVDITGLINPLNGGQTNEIKIVVHDVDLTPTSPYAGKFAGYGIAKGKLNLDLAYHLRGRNLKSENVITLDKFTFGGKVDSPDATKLPVRLAVAILKDRNGKIVLDVPIEGSLDDPQFKVSKVVWRAVENILVKVATSPFSLLGAAFGGRSEEMNFQDFAPGSAELLPPAKEKLDALVKALFDRPALQLEIQGSIDPNADRDGLRRASLEKQLRTAKWLSLRKSARAETSADQIQLTPEDRASLIKKLYAEALSKGTIATTVETVPASPVETNTTNLPPTPAVAATQSTAPVFTKGGALLVHKPVVVAATSAPATVETAAAPNPIQPPVDPEQALLQTIAVGDDDFAGLASARAQAVREYLVQSGKVEAERLFLTENKPGGFKKDGSRSYLQLQ